MVTNHLLTGTILRLVPMEAVGSEKISVVDAELGKNSCRPFGVMPEASPKSVSQPSSASIFFHVLVLTLPKKTKPKDGLHGRNDGSILLTPPKN